MDIAVVVTSFNRGRMLDEALRSVRSQTRPADEIIVVDDGSTDLSTQQILADLEGAGTMVLRQVSTGGPAASRNRGISFSKSELVLCLDDDDKLHPDFIQETLAMFQRDPSLSVVYCDGNQFGYLHARLRYPDITGEWLALGGCPLQASVFRKSAWEEIGGYDEGFRTGYEDYDFWIRLFTHGALFGHVPKPMVYYRTGNTSLMTRIKTDDSLRAGLSLRVYAKNEEFFLRYSRELYIDRLALRDELSHWRRRYSRIDRTAGPHLEKLLHALRRSVRRRHNRA